MMVNRLNSKSEYLHKLQVYQAPYSFLKVRGKFSLKKILSAVRERVGKKINYRRGYVLLLVSATNRAGQFMIRALCRSA